MELVTNPALPPKGSLTIVATAEGQRYESTERPNAAIAEHDELIVDMAYRLAIIELGV